MSNVCSNENLDKRDEKALVAMCGMMFSDLRFELEMLQMLSKKARQDLSSQELRKADLNFQKVVEALGAYPGLRQPFCASVCVAAISVYLCVWQLLCLQFLCLT